MGNCGYKLPLCFSLKTIQSTWVMDNSSRYQQQAIQSPHCTLHVFECEMFEKKHNSNGPTCNDTSYTCFWSRFLATKFVFKRTNELGKDWQTFDTMEPSWHVEIAQTCRFLLQCVWKPSETQFSRNQYEKWDRVRMEIKVLRIYVTLVRLGFEN